MSDWEPLEQGRIEDITKSKARYEEWVQFHYDYYCELDFLRKKIYDSLKNSLREKAAPQSFSNWQRAVKYRYSLSPLSTRGSLVDPGGRFNIGEIDPSHYPTFAALYVASDKKTALAEILGRENGDGPLNPEELALTKPQSVSIVSLSGKLDCILDVTVQSNLTGFVALLEDFHVSSQLISRGRRLGYSIQLIRTVEQFEKGILQWSNWRSWPMQIDVPAPSQIFGRIALDAGIDGIHYNSSLTNRACLAIFPQNFQGSTSFVELDDDPPDATMPKRIDATNFSDYG